MPQQRAEHVKNSILKDVSDEKGFRLTFFKFNSHTVVKIDPYYFESSTSGWYDELGQSLIRVSHQVPAFLFHKIPDDIREQLINTGIAVKSNSYDLDKFLSENNIEASAEYVRHLDPVLEGSGHLYNWKNR